MACLALLCKVARIVVITNVWNMAPGVDWLQHHPVIIIYHLTFPSEAKSGTVKVHDRQCKTNMAATINISFDPLYRLLRMKQIPNNCQRVYQAICVGYACMYTHQKSFATLQPVEQRGTAFIGMVTRSLILQIYTSNLAQWILDIYQSQNHGNYEKI